MTMPRVHRPFGVPQRTLVAVQAGGSSLEFRSGGKKDEGWEAFASTVLVGKKETIKDICADTEAAAKLFGFRVDPSVSAAMLEGIDGPTGSFTAVVADENGAAQRLSFCALPDKVSRHNHPMSVHSITTLLLSTVPSKGDVHVVVAGVTEKAPAAPLASAIAKAFPLYSAKTNKGKPITEPVRKVLVSFHDESGDLLEQTSPALSAAAAVAGHRSIFAIQSCPH